MRLTGETRRAEIRADAGCGRSTLVGRNPRMKSSNSDGKKTDERRIETDGGEPMGEFPVSSTPTDIAESRVDELEAHPGRTAQISHHAGEHPYVRYNAARQCFERASLADGRNSYIEVMDIDRGTLVGEMIDNPVVVKPLSEPEFYVRGEGDRPMWQLVAGDADVVERVGDGDSDGKEIVTDGGEVVTDSHGNEVPPELDGVDLLNSGECPNCGDSENAWIQRPAGYYSCPTCLTIWAGDPDDADIEHYVEATA